MNTPKSLRILFLAIPCLLASFHSGLAAPWTPADLGDRLWLDWWAEDLPNGAVSTWTSRNGSVNATQGTAANQPTKQNGEVYFGYNQKLTFPEQTNANIAHRAIMILFRVDLTGSGDGSLFAVNGVGGGLERQPLVSYNRNTNQVAVSWRTPNSDNGLSFTVAENATQWHCLVARREGTTIYASIDGKKTDGVTAGESSFAMVDWALSRPNIPVTGYIGDFRTSTPPMAFDSVIIVQDEMGQAEAEKLMGWAMWRKGVQAQLPASHPYRNAAPVSTPPEYVFTESTPAEYSALEAFWYDDAQAEQNKGAPLDLNGWNLVFEDQFDQHTVTSEATGKGNWFAPVHGATTGTARAVVPPMNTTDPAIGTQGTPATYIQGNGAMTIRMQQDASGWRSGAFCSVNLNGYGRAWTYPYAECRMKTGPSSTGSLHGCYPSFWIKSQNFFYNLRESYLEYDVYEGYISDNKGFHNSYHNHPGLRLFPGRLTSHRYLSHYLGLKTPGWYQNVNLFDNQYHTYGVMVTPTWTITYFDQREVSRFPTTVEMQQPLWLLTALAMNPDDMAGAAGIYELTVDYIRVYQNPAYDPIDLIGDNAIGESWNTGVDWANGLPAAAGKGYDVGNAAGKVLRTPTSGSTVFPGASLTISPTGCLVLKVGTSTVNNLRLNGGRVLNGDNNVTRTINGNIAVVADSFIESGYTATDTRDLNVGATLSGSGNLTVRGYNTGNVVNLTSAASTYTGNWTVQAAFLDAQGANSLGSGNITVNAGARLDADYAINSPSSLVLNGVMDLDQHHTFGSVTINGVNLSTGTHSFATLNASYNANFTDGGSGSITVMPSINLIGDNASGESWSTGADWSNGLPAAAGNGYRVGNSTGKTLRTPASGSPVFPGSSLTIHTMGFLVLKTGTTTVSNLKLNGGVVLNGNAATQTINGNIAIVASGFIESGYGATDGRDLNVGAAISGSGNLTIRGYDTGNVINLTNAASTYTGNWTMEAVFLDAQGANSLGSGNVAVNAGARLDADYNINNSSSMLILDGVMDLDQNHTFRAVTINGVNLPAGTYSFATLNAAYNASFTDGGSGSITVTQGF